MKLRHFITACLMLVLGTSIYSQKLYENDYRQYSILKKESKEVTVQSLLDETEALLKKKTSNLQDCVDKEDAYNNLLMLHSQDTTIDDICARHPSLIIMSKTECHRYYNCSGEDTDLSRWIDYALWPSKFKHECHYPLMFSEETMQCENYTEVNCSKRYEPTWECRYFRLTCKLQPCKPCEQEYLSCEDREDGLQSSPDQPLHYPKYITCDKGRKIDNGTCPTDAVWNVQSFPYNGTCVQLFGVPKDFNPHGQLPSCNGTVDGDYQFPAGYCRGYYKCEGGEAMAVKCPNNTIFDTARKRCEVGGNCIT